jgi:hypothetical protein
LDAKVTCLLSRKTENIVFEADNQYNRQDICENFAEKHQIHRKALIFINLTSKSTDLPTINQATFYQKFGLILPFQYCYKEKKYVEVYFENIWGKQIR